MATRICVTFPYSNSSINNLCDDRGSQTGKGRIFAVAFFYESRGRKYDRITRFCPAMPREEPASPLSTGSSSYRRCDQQALSLACKPLADGRLDSRPATRKPQQESIWVHEITQMPVIVLSLERGQALIQLVQRSMICSRCSRTQSGLTVIETAAFSGFVPMRPKNSGSRNSSAPLISVATCCCDA